MALTLLKEADMRAVFSMDDAISAARDALRLYSTGKCTIPLRTNLDLPERGGQSLYMYGSVPEEGALGVKIVSVYPGNPALGLPAVPSTMVLLDDRTGQVCALLDGTFLTRLRTGAVSGAATQVLSRPDSRVFALIGTGGQAAAQLEAVLSVRPIEAVRIYSRNRERARAFTSEMSQRFADTFPARMTAVASSAEAVAGADIVTTVTTSQTPVFDGRLLQPGTHINAVGSYTPEMAELDAYTVTHADRIFVDTLDGALQEAGDFLLPMRQGLFTPRQITGELGELFEKGLPGRQTAAEITLFKTTGTAVLDLVCARRIYRRALALGRGQQLPE